MDSGTPSWRQAITWSDLSAEPPSPVRIELLRETGNTIALLCRCSLAPMIVRCRWRGQGFTAAARSPAFLGRFLPSRLRAEHCSCSGLEHDLNVPIFHLPQHVQSDALPPTIEILPFTCTALCTALLHSTHQHPPSCPTNTKNLEPTDQRPRRGN